MSNPLLKKALPHFIAIVVFLIVSALFCKPVLEGNVLNQHDNVGWKGMAQDAFEYKKEHGHFPLWNPNLFSGMPNYQVAMEGKSVLPDMIKVVTLWTPKPINFFFLACICFYILCLSLRTNPIIGMLGALAYAFSTYNAVILAAGHDTQLLATGLMPLVMAGIINIYEKRYWLGFALTTFGAYQQVGVNHLQVTYYFFLVAFIVTLVYLIKWLKEKDWKHIAIAGALTVVAGIIGVAGNALILMTTAEYSKFTMRGGKDLQIEGDTVTATKTKGLDTSYAFEYSLGKGEIISLIMPNAYGGYSSRYAGEESNVVKKLTELGVPENNAIQVAEGMPVYWGKLYTSGPAYLGVIICLLGLIGFVVLKSPIRWGLLAATIFGILIAWGKYLPGFNTFLFEHLPLYNKFRSPAFAQVIPQFTIGIVAVLTLQQLFFGDKLKQTDFKKVLFTAGGLLALLGLMYLTANFASPYDNEIRDSISKQAQNDAIGQAVISGLKADRKALFGGQLLRTLALMLAAIGILYLYFKEKLNAKTSLIILLAISTLEITFTSHLYFSNDKGPFENRQDQLFVSADDYTSANFAKTATDEQILKDKDPNFRVLNMAGTTNGGTFSESRTSYYHKSVGGYHPAKLRIYQDVIEKYLSGNTNQQVLNMLNTKYIIFRDPQSKQEMVIPNPDAYGNCWLVKHVKVTEDRVAAFKSIGTTNLKDTAIVDKSFNSLVVQPQPDSLSTIKMTKFDNDAIEYQASCNGPQFAVFSEVYYPKGWNVYLDGKKANYCNVNYILRGMSVPSGKHTIRFVFEPESVKKGTNIMFMASILVLVILLGGLFMAWKQGRKNG